MEQYSLPNLNIEENLDGAIPPRDLLNNFSIFKNCEETGKGVKICLVGTGKPLVDGVIIQTSVNMGNSQGTGDTHGASSVSSYIIKELAKNSSIFVSKMCDEHGGYSDATIISSILWGISIGCDIILVCCHIDMSNDIIKLVIEKCFDMNKIVVCNSISGKIPKNVINAKEIDIKYKDKIVVTGLNKSSGSVPIDDVKSAFIASFMAILIEKGHFNMSEKRKSTSFRPLFVNYLSQ